MQKGLWLALLGLGLLSGCGYSLGKAVRDAKNPALERRERACSWLKDYLAQGTGASSNLRQRKKAIVALGHTQLNDAVNPLRMVLMHEKHPQLKVEAIRSLSRLKGQSARDEIEKALQAFGLGRLEDEQLNYIFSLTDNEEYAGYVSEKTAGYVMQKAIMGHIDQIRKEHPDTARVIEKHWNASAADMVKH